MAFIRWWETSPNYGDVGDLVKTKLVLGEGTNPSQLPDIPGVITAVDGEDWRVRLVNGQESVFNRHNLLVPYDPPEAYMSLYTQGYDDYYKSYHIHGITYLEKYIEEVVIACLIPSITFHHRVSRESIMLRGDHESRLMLEAYPLTDGNVGANSGFTLVASLGGDWDWAAYWIAGWQSPPTWREQGVKLSESLATAAFPFIFPYTQRCYRK